MGSLPSLSLYRRNLVDGGWPSQHFVCKSLGYVSLYPSIPERMVRDSIDVHLALMSAWCEHSTVVTANLVIVGDNAYFAKSDWKVAVVHIALNCWLWPSFGIYIECLE